MVLGRAREFRPSVRQRVGAQLVEGIAAEWRQITLRERAAKHAATEVLEGIALEAGRQSGWCDCTVRGRCTRRAPTSPPLVRAILPTGDVRDSSRRPASTSLAL